MTEPDSPAASGLLDSLRDDMRQLTQPLANQLEQINARLAALDAERHELIEARRQLNAVLPRLNGTLVAKPGPKTKSVLGRPSAAHEQKIESVLRFLRKHRQDFAEGITVKGLDEAYRKANRSPKVSVRSVQQIIETLHERGVIRMDHRGPGGGIVWKMVGDAS